MKTTKATAAPIEKKYKSVGIYTEDAETIKNIAERDGIRMGDVVAKALVELTNAIYPEEMQNAIKGVQETANAAIDEMTRRCELVMAEVGEENKKLIIANCEADKVTELEFMNKLLNAVKPDSVLMVLYGTENIEAVKKALAKYAKENPTIKFDKSGEWESGFIKSLCDNYTK